MGNCFPGHPICTLYPSMNVFHLSRHKDRIKFSQRGMKNWRATWVRRFSLTAGGSTQQALCPIHPRSVAKGGSHIAKRCENDLPWTTWRVAHPGVRHPNLLGWGTDLHREPNVGLPYRIDPNPSFPYTRDLRGMRCVVTLTRSRVHRPPATFLPENSGLYTKEDSWQTTYRR